MSTPDFLAQNDSNFTPIRYYTALDPYFYTVDNRPLQDIEANLKAIRSGGADAARRAANILSLNVAAVAASLFVPIGYDRGMSGLRAYQISSNVLRILPGAVYEYRTVSTTQSDVVVKQALLTSNTDFSVNAPAALGTSVVYTIEGEFVELNDVTMTTSHTPYVDPENTYLPSTLLNGELKLSLISGSVATTGSEVPAVTTAGKIPLYNIYCTQGSNTFIVKLHDSAPYSKGLVRSVTPVPLTTNGATAGTVDNIPMVSFIDGATKGVTLPLSLAEADLNPYKDLKLRITFSPTIYGGNAAFRIKYKGFANGELTSLSTITSTTEAVPITVNPGGIQTITTNLAKVPAKEFAGFVNGNWAVNKDYLNIILERLGADTVDTASAEIKVLNVTLFQ